MPLTGNKTSFLFDASLQYSIILGAIIQSHHPVAEEVKLLFLLTIGDAFTNPSLNRSYL